MVSPEACLVHSQAFVWTNGGMGWLSLVISLLRVPSVLITVYRRNLTMWQTAQRENSRTNPPVEGGRLSKESKGKCVLSLPYPPPRRSSHVSGHRCCLPPVGGLQVTGERAEGSVLPQSTGSHNRCIIGPGRCLPPSQYPLPHHLMPLHLVSVETFSTIRGEHT